MVGRRRDFVNFPGDEERPNFGFFVGGSGVRVASSVSDSLSATASSFLTSLAAIDRAFAALCFRRLVFIFSNLAICVGVHVCQRSKGGTENEVGWGYEYTLTRLVARFDRGAESSEGGFGCKGLGAKMVDKSSCASSSWLAGPAASLNLDIRRWCAYRAEGKRCHEISITTR